MGTAGRGEGSGNGKQMSLQGAEGEGNVGNVRQNCVTKEKTSEGETEERSQARTGDQQREPANLGGGFAGTTVLQRELWLVSEKG